MEEMIADNRVWFGSSGNNAPAIKRFLTEVKQGIACQTIWKYEEVGITKKVKIKILFPEDVPFDTPKPTRLINRIIELTTATQEQGLILDFSGSGTTGHATYLSNALDGGNRKFILVQLPEALEGVAYPNIAEVTKERLRRAGAKVSGQPTVRG